MRAVREAGVILLIAFFALSSATAQRTPPVSREEFTKRLVAAAIERTHHSVRYVPEYIRLPLS